MQGLLVLSPSRQRDWVACRRRYYLAHVLGLAASDAEADEALGTLVHDELALRHQSPEHHDDPDPIEDGHASPEVLSFVSRHRTLCPREGATYMGGEVDVRWYVRGQALLMSGRVDALWQHPDGTVEIRDYKTRGCPDDLRRDFAASFYALLLAGQEQPRARAITVTFEALAGDQPDVISESVDAAWLNDTWNRVRALSEEVRRERDFAPAPTPGCAFCPYRTVCPASAA